jgi:hypothetical protein
MQRDLKMNDFVTKCPACGGRRRNDVGDCAYCGNPTAFSLSERESDKESPSWAGPQIAARMLVQAEILAREQEIEFLEHQFKETGHASIPLKIQNVQKEIAQLTRSEGEV